MAYAGGKPFASISNVGTRLKFASAAAHSERLAIPGAAPLRYEPGDPPSKTYVLVPRAALHDPAQLADWARASAAHLPPTRKR